MTTSLPSLPQTDEPALIAAAKRGDERAFRRVFDSHRRALEVHCYRMLGSVHDAEDVVQETMLRAWRSLDRFEQRSTVHTWLYRIATNACLDELEQRPRRPEPAEMAELLQPYPDARLADATAPVADPAARYAQHEGMELALLTAIQQLPGRQRAVLILRDVLGWSAREVADLLDTTVAAVNSTLQRARSTVDPAVEARAVAPRAAAERRLLARYVDVWDRADVDGFVALLREDAVLRMPPLAPIAGVFALAEFWFASREGSPCKASRSRLVPIGANGRAGVLIYKQAPDGGYAPFGVMLLETDGERITGFDTWLDPELVRRFEQP